MKKQNEVCLGKIYRHFKGNYYFVENIAYDSETMERMVVYKPIYERTDGKKIWIRQKVCFYPKFLLTDQITLLVKNTDFNCVKIYLTIL